MPEAEGPWSIAPPEKSQPDEDRGPWSIDPPSQPDDDNAPKTEEAKPVLSDEEIVAIFNEYNGQIDPKKDASFQQLIGYKFAEKLYDKGGLDA